MNIVLTEMWYKHNLHTERKILNSFKKTHLIPLNPSENVNIAEVSWLYSMHTGSVKVNIVTLSTRRIGINPYLRDRHFQQHDDTYSHKRGRPKSHHLKSCIRVHQEVSYHPCPRTKDK